MHPPRSLGCHEVAVWELSGGRGWGQFVYSFCVSFARPGRRRPLAKPLDRNDFLAVFRNVFPRRNRPRIPPSRRPSSSSSLPSSSVVALFDDDGASTHVSSSANSFSLIGASSFASSLSSSSSRSEESTWSRTTSSSFNAAARLPIRCSCRLRAVHPLVDLVPGVIVAYERAVQPLPEVHRRPPASSPSRRTSSRSDPTRITPTLAKLDAQRSIGSILRSSRTVPQPCPCDAE